MGLLRRYVNGPGVDEPLVWYEGTGTSTRRYFHADERGSVVAVSDGSGNLVGSAPNRYDEYGVPQGTLTGRFGFVAPRRAPGSAARRRTPHFWTRRDHILAASFTDGPADKGA